jgi:Arm domain-containing DNA-binding protein
MLTDITIKAALRNAKAAGKPQKRYDEKGLYLLVKPNGAALWRFKYVFGVKKATTGKRKGQLVGIEKGIGLGAYSDVPLKRGQSQRGRAASQTTGRVRVL